MTHPGGRPLKFTSPEELQLKIDDYFSTCVDEEGNLLLNEHGHPKKPVTITGLALHLDTYRQTLCNYEFKDEFVDTIKKAKQRVENFYETRLTLNNCAGSVFALKNFDWSDRIDQNIKGDVNHNHTGKVDMGAELIAGAIERVMAK